MSNNAPEIRFKGFTDAWEQRKFSDIINLLSGQDFEPSDYNELGIGTPYMTGASCIIEGKTIANRWTVKPKCVAYQGDVLLVCKGSGYGTLARLVQEKAHIARQFMALQNLPTLDKTFNYYLAVSLIDNIKKDARGLIVGITRDAVLQQDVIKPSHPEQTRIGNFFRTFDDTITLHKRKLDGLRELKKGYLQQMFPQAGERVPRARFAGFAGDWVARKLGDVVERVTRKNTNLESTLPLTISAQHGLIDQTEFFDKQVASKDVSGYFLIKNGEFAYNKSYSNGYPWGAVKRLDRYEMGVLSTLYIVFNSVHVESEFLVQYYETDNWHIEVAKRAAEGARNHGLLNITPSDFFDTAMLLPRGKNEQTAVGSFFRNLDEQINAQSYKVGQLQQLKNAYLKKDVYLAIECLLYNRNGECHQIM